MHAHLYVRWGGWGRNTLYQSLLPHMYVRTYVHTYVRDHSWFDHRHTRNQVMCEPLVCDTVISLNPFLNCGSAYECTYVMHVRTLDTYVHTTHIRTYTQYMYVLTYIRTYTFYVRITGVSVIHQWRLPVCKTQCECAMQKWRELRLSVWARENEWKWYQMSWKCVCLLNIKE